MATRSTARVHLLPAKEAPVVVIISRKPSRVFHIAVWNTQKDTIEHGSWFDGKLYVKRCDVSFDGKWLVYLAMGAGGQTWNGCCRLPFLKTHLEGDNFGSWNGGGYWPNRKTLLLNAWTAVRGSVPFATTPLNAGMGEDFTVLYPRMRRDGWTRMGDNYGAMRKVPGAKKYTVVCEGDDGWQWRHPKARMTLEARYTGYLDFGYTFAFTLREHPELIPADADWATWDAPGHLIVAHQGQAHRYTRAEIHAGKPGVSIDCNAFTALRPARQPDSRPDKTGAPGA